ncbi:MAG: hypothetical protein HKP58_05100 [Desulfatitalea sp.]|nr:hypothetical protein [Desulfatitalea sp.]NNJ99770.1 hypothetical protein [Desulfatitalea sp.]
MNDDLQAACIITDRLEQVQLWPSFLRNSGVNGLHKPIGLRYLPAK